MIIYLIGAIQGLVTGIILLAKRERHLSLIFLSTLILSLSLQLGIIGFYSPLIEKLPSLRILGWTLPFVFAPLIYLYLRSYLTSQKVKWPDLTHLIPIVIGLLMCLPYLHLSKEEQISLQILDDSLFRTIALTVESLRVTQSIFYAILSLRLLKKSVNQARANLSNFDLKWIWSFFGFNVLAWLLALIGTIFYFLEFEFPNVYNILYVFVVISIYLLSWKLMSQSEFFPGKERRAEDKYGNNPLKPQVRVQYLNRLEMCMNSEQLFKNPQLRLQELADHLEIPAHHLSQTINSELDQNFYDYINWWRVEYVKNQFQDSSQNHLKILAIAFDAGFNSKSTFNTIFKKYTGQTPSAFRNN